MPYRRNRGEGTFEPVRRVKAIRDHLSFGFRIRQRRQIFILGCGYADDERRGLRADGQGSM